MASQKARFVTTESVKRLLENQQICLNDQEKVKCDKLETMHLISLAAANEETKQSRENSKLAFANIENEVRNFVLQSLAKEVLKKSISKQKLDSAKLAEKLRVVRPLFVRTTRNDPSSWINKNPASPKKSVLEQYLESKIKDIKSIFAKEEIEKLEAHIKKLIGTHDAAETEKHSLEFFLDAEIPSSVSSGEGAELQLELLTESKQEIDLESHASLELSLKAELNQLASNGSFISYEFEYSDFTLCKLEHFLQGKTILDGKVLPFSNFNFILDQTLQPAEKKIITAGLGNVDLMFSSSISEICNSSSLLSSNLKTIEGFVCAEYQTTAGRSGKLILMCARGLQELFTDLVKYSQRSLPLGINFSVTDMAGRYIGPSEGPSFLIKKDLLDIPG